jgi:hypothetical protein
MALSVTTPAQTTRLTTVAAVQAELGLSAGTDDALILRLIDRCSSAIVNYCRRPFAREALTETCGGFGGITLQLARTPVVALGTISQDSALVTDATISDADKGWLYRRDGWAWTTQLYGGLSGGGAWMDYGTPLPRQEEPQFSVAYTAGYILPEQARLGTASISASSVDNSFNDADSRFPSLLKAGDVVVVEGGVNAGRHIVSGTPTTSKIVVTSTLTTETAHQGVDIRFEAPAQCRPFRDVEAACIEAVKSAYINRRDDPSIVEKQAGPMRLRYSEQQDSLGLGIPSVCVGLLRPWVRAA